MRKTLCFAVAFAATTALCLQPAGAAPAGLKNTVCVTTEQVSKSRPWPGSRHVKMSYCTDGAQVTVKILAKGISSNITTFNDAKVSFKVRNLKNAVVYNQDLGLGDLNFRFGSPFGISYWVSSDVLSFALPKLPAGGYQLEGQLLIDWAGDGKGFVQTPYKQLPFIVK